MTIGYINLSAQAVAAEQRGDFAEATKLWAAVLGAIYLASQGKDGWGWLVFLALVMDCSIELKTD